MGAVQSDINVYAPPFSDVPPPRALYIHVPFCLHRCGYCDFTLVAQQDDLIPQYLNALAAELAMCQESGREVDTIFVGGGTPTHLSVKQLAQLFRLIQQHFCLSSGGEFSVEANPDGLSDECLKTLADHGVNRLSLGVQSFDNSVLKTLERQHTAVQAIDVVHRAAEFISNVSVDLIFGVPGQSVADWQASLTTAAAMPIKHVSTYGLTFEKGTDFFRRLRQGSLTAIPDNTEREMYALAIAELVDRGFTHYEISNFARPGRPCRHNLTYWDGSEYFAFGPGAARYINGVRSTNARNVKRWIKCWLQNQPALQEVEQLSRQHRISEAVFLGLRKVAGIDIAEFSARFGVSPLDVAPDAVCNNIESGLLEVCDDFLRLTDEGRFVADSVVIDFL